MVGYLFRPGMCAHIGWASEQIDCSMTRSTVAASFVLVIVFVVEDLTEHAERRRS